MTKDKAQSLYLHNETSVDRMDSAICNRISIRPTSVAFTVPNPHLCDHEDKDWHGRRLIGLLDAVVLAVVVVVVRTKRRRRQACFREEKSS